MYELSNNNKKVSIGEQYNKNSPLPSSSNTMNAQPNPSSSLTNHCTVLQCIIDTLDTVVFHAHQKATRHLWVRGPGVEQCRGGMGEVPFGHEVVSLEDALDVRAVDANGDTHDHVLWALGDAAVDAEKVRSFESLEAEAEGELV